MPDPARLPSGPVARARALVPLLLIAAVAATAVLVRGGGGHVYRVELVNAGQLVTGDDLVRIGGVAAGSIERIGVGRRDQAVVTIRLHRGRPPLREGTTAVVRARGLAGVASRYIDVSPAPDTAPAIRAGGVLTADRTRSIVDLDQLFNTLDADTRSGLRDLIDGSADWYDGVENQANRSARYAQPALAQLRALAAEVDADSPAFAQFLVQVGDATSTLAQRREQLTALIGDSRTTAAALSQDSAALGAGLRRLTPAVRRAARTLDGLRAATPDLRRLVAASDEPSRVLPGLLRDARPAAARAVPAVADLRRAFDAPGRQDDLVDALRGLPRLASLTGSSVPRARRALRDGLPVIRFIRPYTPDLVAWLQSFGSVTAAYDAMGHYARTQPVFDAYAAGDDGTLIARAPEVRGTAPALRTGNLRRCPGAAAPTADGSGNTVDSGPDANADCDPSQAIGGDG